MASIELKDRSLIVHVEGIDRLLSLRSTLTVALRHVTGIIAKPPMYNEMFMSSGERFRGVQIAGVMCAGTVRTHDGSGYVFCDVHDPERAISIELEHDTFKRLLVELSDETPAEAKERIEAAIAALR